LERGDGVDRQAACSSLSERDCSNGAAVERLLGKEENEFFGQSLVKMVAQLFFYQFESVKSS